MGRFELRDTAPVAERAILVGVDRGRGDWTCEDSMAELERLAQTDGAVVVHRMHQRLDAPVPKTFIGSGKVHELCDCVSRFEADVVIFDDELTPSQQANLERAVGEPTKIIDRTALILDIFGVHARTHEGRLQVQLAQLQYLLPRLRGMWSHLVGEQTRGGIGSRFGQGESQLEVDRRMVRSRISTLRGELFATLDPTTRSLALPEGRKVTVTDTVGFIQKLPTTLVESFKSTLAEACCADLLLLVVDASDPHERLQQDAVVSILHEIGAQDVPRVVVYNKCDLLSSEDREGLAMLAPDAELVSAIDGTGAASLLSRIAREASRGDIVLSALLPYAEGALIHRVRESSQVMSERYQEDGLLLTAKVDARLARALERYRLG